MTARRVPAHGRRANRGDAALGPDPARLVVPAGARDDVPDTDSPGQFPAPALARTALPGGSALSGVWLASYIVLWVLVLLLAFLLGGALRQLGLFQLRLGDDPGALITDSGLDLNSAVEEFENRLIEEALRRTKGNKQAAARLLGLKRTTLVAKLRRRKGGGVYQAPTQSYLL